MTIYLIRHGETTADLEHRFGGDYDDHLTERGIAQSRELAAKLAGRGIQSLWVSPKHRAQETAKLLQAELNCPLDTVQDFRERNHYGVLSGLTREEAAQTHRELLTLLQDRFATIPGGESYQEFSARVMAVWAKLAHAPYATLGVVTHGGVIRFVFREILKLGEIELADCCFVQLETQNDQVSIITLDGIKV